VTEWLRGFVSPIRFDECDTMQFGECISPTSSHLGVSMLILAVPILD
jgi:hypothetical protein